MSNYFQVLKRIEKDRSSRAAGAPADERPVTETGPEERDAAGAAPESSVPPFAPRPLRPLPPAPSAPLETEPAAPLQPTLSPSTPPAHVTPVHTPPPPHVAPVHTPTPAPHVTAGPAPVSHVAATPPPPADVAPPATPAAPLHAARSAARRKARAAERAARRPAPSAAPPPPARPDVVARPEAVERPAAATRPDVVAPPGPTPSPRRARHRVTAATLTPESQRGIATLFDNIRALASAGATRTLVFAGAAASDSVHVVTEGLARHAERHGMHVIVAELLSEHGGPTLVPLATGVDAEEERLALDLKGSAAPGELNAWIERIGPASDFVLLEGPPLAESIDAALLACACDGLVIVADAEVTPRGALQTAAERAQRSGCRTLGVVMSGTKERLPSWVRRLIGGDDRHPRSGDA